MTPPTILRHPLPQEIRTEPETLVSRKLAQVPDRGDRRGHTEQMGVDQHLVIGAVDRVVEHGAVQPALHAFEPEQGSVHHDGVLDFRGKAFNAPRLGLTPGDPVNIIVAHHGF